MAKLHETHVTRMSDSSHYDEVCVLCGMTDANGYKGGLENPCPVGFKHHSSHNRSIDSKRQVYCKKCVMAGSALEFECTFVPFEVPVAPDMLLIEPLPDAPLTMIYPKEDRGPVEVNKREMVPRGNIVEVKTPHGPVHGKPDALWYVLDLVEQDSIRQEVGPHLSITGAGFTKDLQALINAYSLDTDLNTPDYILAQVVNNLLMTFGNGLEEVRRHEGRNEILEELKFEPVDPDHKVAYRRETPMPTMEWYP